MRFSWLAEPPFTFSPQVSWDSSAFPQGSGPAHGILGAAQESPHADDSLRQCHIGDAIPGFAGAEPAAPQ